LATSSSEIDALFQLPLNEFTPARNALAAKLKKAGRIDDAASVKGLAKPPVSAWAVNQLYWKHREPFERLLAAGDRLRSAQASQLRGKGGELKEPLEARRVALSELSQQAGALLREAGHTPSPDLMRRITTTLEALATYGSKEATPAAGRLTNDIDPPGFEALASLVPSGRSDRSTSAGGPNRVLPFVSQRRRAAPDKKLSPEDRKRKEEAEHRERLAAATAAIREAQRSLEEAQRNEARAEAALKKAAALAKETKKEHDALSARMEKVAADAEKARDEARRVAAEAEEATQAVADAERALEQARREYKSLSE
jgi:DNA repair exonuclease SbcCD ATPase subunit